jgi:hypothetical protein
MYKNMQDTSSPYVWTKDLTGSFAKTLYLNSAVGETTSSTMDAVSSTLVTVPDGGATDSPNRLIAWAFHSVDGYSKFGSYEGNGGPYTGGQDGPFINLGFRPKFILIKTIDDNDSWILYDSERGWRLDANRRNYKQLPSNDSADSEHGATKTYAEFFSNGVKLRDDDNTINKNGDK